MIDYRQIPMSQIVNDIKKFKKTSTLYNDVLNGYLRVCVWHSIASGQVTPANELINAIVPNLKDSVSQYLTKYGNIRKDGNGFKSDKTKNKERYGVDAANHFFKDLPDLDEAFPPAVKQYRDIPFFQAMKKFMQKVEESKQHGKTLILASDEEKKLFEDLSKYVASHA